MLRVDLKNQWALVTAGHVRLGRAISRALARAGANILFTFRSDRASADEAQRELEGLGAHVQAVRCELGDATDALIARLDANVDRHPGCRQHLSR